MRRNYRKTSSTKKSTGASDRGTTRMANGADNIPNQDGILTQPPPSQRAAAPSLLDAHDDLLSVKAVAEMLNLTEHAIRHQIRKKQLKARIHCEHYVFLRSELMHQIRNSKSTMDTDDSGEDDAA